MRRAIAAAALTLLAVSGPAPAFAQPRETLTIAITQFPATLHPMIDSMAAKTYVLGMARRPLTTFDKDWKLVCLLCVELPTFGNGGAKRVPLADGKEGVEVTFHLDPRAKWGDGTPVTAADAIFAWDVGRHPRSGVAGGEGYRRILKVEAKDARTVAFTQDRVTFSYNDFSQYELLPAHIDRQRFEGDPENYRRRTAFDTEPTNPGLFNGPYRIVQVQPGASITLEPNAQWGGPKPYFRRIVVRTIENSAALEANLLSGSVDYVAGELGFTLDQALALEKRQAARFDFTYVPSLLYEHVDLNLDVPAFKDIRVRRALLFSADRAGLVRQLFEGRQPVARSFVNPRDSVYAPDVPEAPYDPERAKTLLDEAGYAPGPDGIRRDKEGNRLSFEFGTTAGNRIRETVQQALQANWRRVGIEARIRNEPARVYFGETLRKRRFQLAMYAWFSAPEAVPRTTLHSESIPSEANAWSGQNQPGIADAETDAMIDALERELDPAKRKPIWARLQARYAEEAWVLPLYYRADPFVIPKWLSGIEPTGHQYYSSLRIEYWRPK
ncbi:MAG: peptide ABC transporter substrate-binding protein [Alphaproteobacteria bacterium]|nr:peptide ABC transporter substrate-binding protein [Alphaproteobacteria bacterium]